MFGRHTEEEEEEEEGEGPTRGIARKSPFLPQQLEVLRLPLRPPRPSSSQGIADKNRRKGVWAKSEPVRSRKKGGFRQKY